LSQLLISMILNYFANGRAGYEATNSAPKAQESRRRILHLSACTTTAVLRLQWHQKLARMLASLRAKVSLRNRHDVVHITVVHITACASRYCASRYCARRYCAHHSCAHHSCAHHSCARHSCAHHCCAHHCCAQLTVVQIAVVHVTVVRVAIVHVAIVHVAIVHVALVHVAVVSSVCKDVQETCEAIETDAPCCVEESDA
jgi:hypothetical protein